VLDPAWSDFSKRIYYAEYDVTFLMQEGDNCLGVSLGNGFYNPLPLSKWSRRNLRNDLTTGKPVFIAKLLIKYQNGESKEIVTDRSWKYEYGPIVKNDVYLGTAYDARREIKGWKTTDFDDGEGLEAGQSVPCQSFTRQLLFKKMKQYFQLHYFYGENENAIRTQVWSTLIAQLLLTVIQKIAQTKKAFSVVAALARMHLISMLDINELLRSTKRDYHIARGSPDGYVQLALYDRK